MAASAPHTVTAADAYAHTAAQYGMPPGPFASTATSAFSSGAGGGGAQPLASLADQVLADAAAAAHGEDPVAAARQLQSFLGQYQHQYGAETDARIGAAIAKLQDYIDGAAAGGGGGSAAGLRDALGAFGAADTSASAAAAAAATGAAAGASGGGGEAPVYHNYILEQLTGVLDWVNNLLVRNGTPKPFVYDAYGRVVEDAGAAASVEQQQEQLRAASQSLRLLIQQLQQVWGSGRGRRQGPPGVLSWSWIVDKVRAGCVHLGLLGRRLARLPLVGLPKVWGRMALRCGGRVAGFLVAKAA